MAARAFPLLGTDVLLVAMGRGRPNNAVLVVHCEGRLDAARVRRAAERLATHVPWSGVRLHRPFPWGRLWWRLPRAAGPAPVHEVTVASGETVDDAITRILNAGIDPWRDPPVQLHVVRDRTDDTLVMAWAHPLMDPRGAELWLTMLDAADRGDLAWIAERTIVPPPDPRSLRERALAARSALEHLERIRTTPRRSLARGHAHLGTVRFRRITVPGSDAIAQFPGRLATVGRAVAELWQARGLPADEPFLVPVSVDRRRKGEPGPVFGNYVTFHFAIFTPASTADPSAAAATIRRGMAESVRDGAIDAMWTGTNLMTWQPPHKLLRPLGDGDTASFNCADTGPVRPLGDVCCGAPVRNAFHAPCVPASPGLGIFLSQCRRQQNVVVVWIEPVLRPGEPERLLDTIATALVPQRAAS